MIAFKVVADLLGRRRASIRQAVSKRGAELLPPPASPRRATFHPRALRLEPYGYSSVQKRTIM
jgi:hypothetical protein